MPTYVAMQLTSSKKLYGAAAIRPFTCLHIFVGAGTMDLTRLVSYAVAVVEGDIVGSQF